MAEGFEQREVVKGLDPSGRANQPARQLGMVGVQAPRGGSTAAVGNASAVLGEVYKVAGKQFQQYLDNKEIEDGMAGEMAYAQGQTEAQLNAAGANRATLGGFKALRAKTSFNEWKTGAELEIENADYALDPNQYRQKLQEGISGVLPMMDSSDPAQKAMVSEFLNKGMQDLVRKQMVQNTQHMQTEYGNSLTGLLYSEAKSGDTDSLNEVVSNIDQLAPTLSEDARDESLVSAVRQSLMEGNFALYDAVGGVEGMRMRNLNETTITSLNKSYEQAQVMQESTFMSEIDGAHRQLTKDIDSKNITAADAQEQLTLIQDTYRLSDTYVRKQLKSALAGIGNRDEEQAEAATMYNPQFLAETSAIIAGTSLDGMTDDVVNQVLQVSDKYGIGHDKTMDLLDRAKAGHNSYTQGQVVKLQTVARKQEAKIALETKAASVISSNFTDSWAQDTKVVDTAMRMKREEIAAAVHADTSITDPDEKFTEIASAHVDFLTSTAVIDKQLVSDMKSISWTNPTNTATGALDPEHEQALQYMGLMRDASMNESIIKKYAGDGYEYLSTATDLMSGGVDPQGALDLAYEMTQIPEGDRPLPKTTEADIRNMWGGSAVGNFLSDTTIGGALLADTAREAFFDNMDPSVMSGWFGTNADGQWDEVLSWQVEEIAENTPGLDDWVVKQGTTIAQAYPNMRPEAVMNLAMKRLSSWEYVMGNLVPPSRDGKSISQAMGLQDTPGTLKSNTAMLVYMRDDPEGLFPEGTDTKEWWESTMGHLADQTMESIGGFVEASIYGEDKAKVAELFGEQRSVRGDTSIGLTMFTEKSQRLQNDIKLIDVTPMTGGKLLVTMYKDVEHSEAVGASMSIDAKKIGDYYKLKLDAERRAGAQ